SPHGGAGAKLPDRKALSTSAMYFYERVAATQNINGIKVFFNKKIAKEKPTHARALEFENAMKLVKDSPKDQLAELSWAGKFYDICSQAANQIFGLGVTEFSGDQRQVADHEYQELKATWAGALTQKFDDFKEVMSYKILSAASADQIIGLLRGPSKNVFDDPALSKEIIDTYETMAFDVSREKDLRAALDKVEDQPLRDKLREILLA